MADVQVAVGLGRKAGLDDGIAVLLRLQILNDGIADEVRGARLGGRVCGQLRWDLDEDEFVVLILLVFYMGRMDSRLLARRSTGVKEST
jgi:hypothetical protein